MKSKIVCIITVLLALSVQVHAESRNALLIANGNYTNFSGLANPVPEAEALAKSLKQLGFDVTVQSNLSREQMADCLYDFQRKVEKSGGIAFFHYGGHAVQVKGINYLIPADADIPDERRIDTRALNLDEVMASMRGETNIVVLDACRNNPLPAGEGRSASRGLVPIDRKPRNSVIVYSAQAGSTAQDGVFTPILTKKILEQKSFTQIIRDVRVAVKQKTNNQQNPGSYDDSDNEIYLAGQTVSTETAKLERSQKEYDDLEQEIIDIKARMNAKKSEKEQQKTQLDLQKKEAEAQRKKFELEQQQEIEAKRLALEKRQREIQSEYEKNQQAQELEFIKVQQANAKKQKLLQQSQKDASSIDDVIEMNIRLNNTIDEITKNYNSARQKALEQIQTFYAQKYAEVGNMKKDKWELQFEFVERQQMERMTYQNNEKEENEQINQRYDNEISESTKEFKQQLAVNQEKIIHVSKDVHISFGNYNEEKQYFPGTIAFAGTYLKVTDKFTLNISSPNAKERRIKGMEIENKIKSNGYVGEIEQCMSGDKPMARKYRIIDISTNKPVYEKEIKQYGSSVAGLSSVQNILNDGGFAEKNKPAKEPTNPNAWYLGKYQSHKYMYGALIGVGSGIGCGSAVLLAVGAVNVADCYAKEFQKGIAVSFAILGAGIGTALFSAIIIPTISGVWYKDASFNGGLRHQAKYLKSSHLSRHQKAAIGLCMTDIFGGYDCEKDSVLVGMGIRL